MRKLTMRERILIYMAVILALLAAEFYVSQMPVDSAEAGLRADLTALTLQLEQQKQLIGRTEELETERLRLEADIEKNYFQYPVYKKSNTDMMIDLTELLTACGIVPERVEVVQIESPPRMSSAEDVESPPHMGSAENVESPDNLIDLTGMAGSDEVNDSDSRWHVLVAQIDVSAVGTMEHICSLFDMIELKPWISVTSFESDRMDRLRMTLTYSMLELPDTEMKH